MSYSVKLSDDNTRKVIKGTYVPIGFTCECKECNYTIEVLKCATKEQIEALVKIIEGK